MKLRPYNRSGTDTLGYIHWCPGCNEPHAIAVAEKNSMGATWTFNGDMEKPTFTPSVRIRGKQTVKDADGKWTGDWVKDAAGNPVDFVCHYFINNGNIDFCSDSTHEFSGKSVPLPDHWDDD